jgi:hypothetical protein
MNNFDWNYYLENNIDLKKSGFRTKEDAIIHWTEYGEKEGRPHRFLKNETEYYIMNIQNLLTQNIITKEESWDMLINIIIENNKEHIYFDWEYYLIENENLFKTVLTSKEEALEHWNNIGKYDNNFKYSKDYLILEKISKDNFDWIYYIKNNVDLIKNNVLTYDKVWEHWINYGKYENRKYKCKFDQNITYETFDWEYYLNKNHDLINLTQEGAWQHWIYYGRNENRDIRLYSKIDVENNFNLVLNNNIDNTKSNIEDFSLIINNENNNSKELIINNDKELIINNSKDLIINNDKELIINNENNNSKDLIINNENNNSKELIINNNKELIINNSKDLIINNDKELIINNDKELIINNENNKELELNKHSIEYYLELLNNKDNNKNKLKNNIKTIYNNIQKNDIEETSNVSLLNKLLHSNIDDSKLKNCLF